METVTISIESVPFWGPWIWVWLGVAFGFLVLSLLAAGAHEPEAAGGFIFLAFIAAIVAFVLGATGVSDGKNEQKIAQLYNVGYSHIELSGDDVTASKDGAYVKAKLVELKENTFQVLEY